MTYYRKMIVESNGLGQTWLEVTSESKKIVFPSVILVGNCFWCLALFLFAQKI